MTVPFSELLNLKLADDTRYNRVEGSPRLEEADIGLRAEIRDPLWMLARQWVLGEFQGDDAASPVSSEVTFERLPIDYPSGRLPTTGLLEAEVESQTFEPDVRARSQAGLALRRLTDASGLQIAYDALLTQFPIHAREGSGLVNDVGSQGFVEGCTRFVADGWTIVQDHENGDAVLSTLPINLAELAPLIDQVRDELETTYGFATGGPDLWQPASLEYETTLGVGGDSDVLRIDEYHGGRLDWWNFELESQPDWSKATRADPQTHLPAAIEFPGMPLARYWEIEDWRIDFGRVTAAKTDLARLLLVEFALAYSEDWFLIPIDAPRGSILRITDLIVTNTFGEKFHIPQAGRASSLGWDRWSTGHPSVTSRKRAADNDGLGSASDEVLVFAPASNTATNGAPIEEVIVSRDEMANTVWGIELSVSNLLGEAKSMADYWRNVDPPTLPTPEGDGLHYTLMTDVPFNWIPFVPVGEIDESGFARSRGLVRVPFVRTTVEGDKHILPKGALIGTDEGVPYVLNEEGVNRVAQRLVRRFERARRPDGTVALWISRSRQAAQPQAMSDLRFDTLANLGQGDPH